MKKIFSLLLNIIIIIFWSSCRDDFNFNITETQLQFSKDTVYLDTVFSNIGSSTYNLKVYNTSNENILIPYINLENGQDSYYRLNVDGMYENQGNVSNYFENIELLANDSLFIFIETTIDINNLPSESNQFLYTDKIKFDTGYNLQTVDLITLVKDAVFIYPNKYTDSSTGETIIETLNFDINNDGISDETNIQGRFLSENELNFTNEKPYVIYGYAGVPSNSILTIDKGARVHFHSNSGILVTSEGSIQVNGEFSQDQEVLENEVIFEGDRLENSFANTPGQWGTIWLFSGSTNNIINFSTIKNATIGIYAENQLNTNTNQLTINNSKIYNSSNFGVLAKSSSITASNLVINKSGQSSFAATYGGQYELNHCTITNFWNNSFRQFPSLLINNYWIDSNGNVLNNSNLNFNINNSIISGNENIEFLIEQFDDSNLNFKFKNCMMKFNDYNEIFTGQNNYDFLNLEKYENIYLNLNTDFKNEYNNELFILQNSEVINLGDQQLAAIYPLDLLYVNRENSPDLGAYQHVIIED
jgi:hypothetical protein